MKSTLLTTVIALAMTAPAVAFAQNQAAPVTRAEVRADLVALEHAGYQPSRVSPDYPSDLQAAEAKVAAQQMGNSLDIPPHFAGTAAQAN